jgi:hypothetical protein
VRDGAVDDRLLVLLVDSPDPDAAHAAQGVFIMMSRKLWSLPAS